MDAFFLLSGFSFVLPIILVFGLIIVLALRNDGDVEGRRPYAIYLAMTSYVALFTLLFASFIAVNAVVEVVTNEESGSRSQFEEVDFQDQFPEGDFGFDEELGFQDDRDLVDRPGADDKAWNDFAIAVIVSAVAAAILWFHHPLLRAMGRPPYDGTPHWRVVQAHRLVVCFTAVVTVLIAAAVALYGVFQAAAPGVTDVGDRGNATANIARAAYLAVAAAVIFAWHWQAPGTRPATPVAEGWAAPPPASAEP